MSMWRSSLMDVCVFIDIIYNKLKILERIMCSQIFLNEKNTNSKTFWEPAVNKRLLNSSFENQLVLIKKMTKVFQNTCEGVPFYKSFESSDTAPENIMNDTSSMKKKSLLLRQNNYYSRKTFHRLVLNL